MNYGNESFIRQTLLFLSWPKLITIYFVKKEYFHQLNQNHHEEGHDFIFGNPT